MKKIYKFILLTPFVVFLFFVIAGFFIIFFPPRSHDSGQLNSLREISEKHDEYLFGLFKHPPFSQLPVQDDFHYDFWHVSSNRAYSILTVTDTCNIDHFIAFFDNKMTYAKFIKERQRLLWTDYPPDEIYPNGYLLKLHEMKESDQAELKENWERNTKTPFPFKPEDNDLIGTMDVSYGKRYVSMNAFFDASDIKVYILIYVQYYNENL